MAYRLDGTGFDFQWVQEMFTFSKMFRPALWPTQSPIQWAPVIISPQVKQLGNKADHSPPFSVTARNEWSYTSAPTCPHGMQLGQLYLCL